MSQVQQHSISSNTVTISLSLDAKKHILRYLRAEPKSTGVRFSVKKTGCSGLSYVIDYVITSNETDISQSFSDNYQIYIDKASYPYLKGLHVDYIQQGLNHKFIFNNPNQTGACGCGESFTVNPY